MPTYQVRRYELHPEVAEQFLTWWQQIPPARQPFGFTVESAHLDRAASEFTWIVSYEGDLDAFKAADAAWFSSPERAALFVGQPTFTKQIHLSIVDRIF